MKRTLLSSQAGYSTKSLSNKLGLKEGMVTAALFPPDHYFSLLGEEAKYISKTRELTKQYDFVHVFFFSKSELEKHVQNMIGHMSHGGFFWISWPKKSSGIISDLDENVLREVVLPLGWVDVKVCAIDQTWSGLQFRKRTS